MKFYKMDTRFSFGKHKGYTVKEVFEKAPFYLEFCVLNLNHFYLSEEVLEEMQALKPDLIFSQKASEKLIEKYDAWIKEEDRNHEPAYYYNDNRDLDHDNFMALTDGMLGDYDDWRDSGLDYDDAMTYMRG